MKLKHNKKLYIKRSSFCDKRNGLNLLIWGNIGEWMVVDNEASDFINSLEESFFISDILKDSNKKYRKEKIQLIGELFKKNILSHNKKEQEKKEEISIANITYNITNKCNQNCKWCYNSGRNTEELPIKQIIKSIDLKNNIFNKKTSFFILGGEPFIDFVRLEKTLQYVWSNFKTPPLVSTNGTLITKENINKLKNKKVEIQVSLSGTTKEEHDSVCGKGSFEKALNGIHLLVDSGIHTILCMVYTNESYKQFEKYLKFASNLNVNEVRFIPMRVIGKGCEHALLMPDQYNALNYLVNIINNHPEYKKLLIRDFFSITMAACRYSSYRDSCGIGRRVVFVDADGSVYPCPNFTKPESLCGNLLESSLSDIIQSSDVMNKIRREYKVENYINCNNCDFCHWCAGDCRAETIALTGSYCAPSPHCSDMKKVYREMFWLIAEGFNFS